MKFYAWFLNRKVLSDTAFRIIMLLRYRLDVKPHLQEKKILSFSRKDIGVSTGLSYNSVQSGLRALIKLGLIRLDPCKTGNKQVLRLCESSEFNWEIIQDKLGFKFIVAKEEVKK